MELEHCKKRRKEAKEAKEREARRQGKDGALKKNAAEALKKNAVAVPAWMTDPRFKQRSTKEAAAEAEHPSTCRRQW